MHLVKLIGCPGQVFKMGCHNEMGYMDILLREESIRVKVVYSCFQSILIFIYKLYVLSISLFKSLWVS